MRLVVKRDRYYVTLEVMAEVSYVLEGLYQVSRKDIVDNFRKLNFIVTILNVDDFLRALEILINHLNWILWIACCMAIR